MFLNTGMRVKADILCRKAALKWHPDKNRDKPDASEKFKGKPRI